MIKEACVETLGEALSAELNGADRIELCSRLDLDGLTPDTDLIQKTISSLSILVKAMIRPRGGNFVYTENELISMESEIDQCKLMGVTEVVLGVLNQQNKINVEATARLSKRAHPMKVTFHKAIDESPNILFELEKLKSIPEVTSVLTSGGHTTAEDGKDVLIKMIQIAKDQLTIIPAGRITNQNLQKIHESIGASEYHGRRIVGKLS
ncbi:MAG: copper homeostasis protein CutC [Candidatus Marinimicrobia bacterium]|jgi:copper homeostasis protein|nr:copper homeostasis protein CutC [Candidatus Neomarinimicrobiota bacterium]MBT3676774.1 copper homeostasis protein CutC [Candidatus Neomarinimicrobiota bacterium]MBT3763925.1 copper homeostasis protein CutC [Candidatus Neomarinimicrobiota bacterium]MBT4067922.1 copper homeostasis protein CutC [Candidatus Neomarinimicrobiota bacterium]MBT4271123.1 copper homeostasis protein CutC [Candidatus Neomarinimicrobiota bacterium]